MGRIAGWMAVLVLTLYLVFFGGSWYGLYSTTIRATSVVLALLTLATWFAIAWRRPAWRARSAFLPVIGLALASLAVSTIFSRYPRQSVEYVGYALILAALYLLLVRLMANPFLRIRIGGLATTLCLVLSVAYVGRTVLLWIDYWDAVGRLTIPPLRPAFESLMFGDPASVLTIVVLLYATGLAASWPKSRRGAVGALILGILVAITVVVGGSGSQLRRRWSR